MSSALPRGGDPPVSTERPDLGIGSQNCKTPC